MTADELIEQLESLGGRIFVDGDRIKVQAPKGAITPGLRDALAAHKQDIILRESMKRLEAKNILIAVNEDGDMRIVNTDADRHQAVLGFAIYEPREAYYFIQLQPHERRLLHRFKRTFGGTVEWKKRNE